MAFVKLNLLSKDAEGTTGMHWGYSSIVKGLGAIWAEVRDDMLELEIACGRVDPASVPVVETPKTPKTPKPPKPSKGVVSDAPTTVVPVSDAPTTVASAE